MAFTGGLNAMRKTRSEGWENNSIWGENKVFETKNLDPWARYKKSDITPTSSAKTNLSINRDNQAYLKSEQGIRDMVQPFDGNGRVNQDFVQYQGESALKNAENQIAKGYKTK